MARALWKGSINFGLVALPVELLVADSSQSLDFDMLDKRDNSPIKYKRVNANTQKEVKWNDIVKGYKTKDGDYVIVTKEDFQKANVKATQTIDIMSFVNLEDVDVAYFEKPYYLKPAKGGAKPYALLHKTLLETGKVGIATVVIRTKQHLAAVMPRKDILILEILRFPDELHPREGVDIPKVTAPVSAKEIKMAKDLVESMSEKWDPKQYKDTYREDLMKMIKYKIKHGETESLPSNLEEGEPDEDGNVLDLMPLLRKSLEEGKSTRKAKSNSSSKPAKKKVKRGATKVHKQA